jgi:hypothetical protein
MFYARARMALIVFVLTPLNLTHPLAVLSPRRIGG